MSRLSIVARSTLPRSLCGPASAALAGRIVKASAGTTSAAWAPAATGVFITPVKRPNVVCTRPMPSSTPSSAPGRMVLRPMNCATKRAVGPRVEVARAGDLLDPAVAHHDDPVRHCQRLGLGVGHEDESDAEVDLQQLQLRLDGLAEIGVERAERLVEQQDVGLDHQPARERDALPLPAGKPVGLLVGDIASGRACRQDALDLGVALGAAASP